MTILITGATGTIGRLLVGDLAPNRVVRTFGRRKPAGHDVEHIDGDVVDFDAVVRATAGVDAVVHLAGLLEGEDGLQTLEANLRGTYHVLEAAHVRGVKRVVFASSIAVTGCLSSSFIPEHLPIRETDPCRPASPYAMSKLAAEVLCDGFASAYALTTVALRLAGVQRPEDWEEPPWDGQRSPILWTWISARDASRAIVASIDAAIDGAAVINVAAADTCSLRPTRELIEEFLPGASIRGSVDGIEARWPLFDLDRSGRLLGWKALDRFEDVFKGGRSQ